MQVNTCKNIFVQVTKKKFNMDMLELLAIAAKHANFASAGHMTLEGINPDIYPNYTLKNFKDAIIAMSRKDRQE